MQKTVLIDCFPENALQYRRGYAVVVIDVIRATTMAVTAVATGHRCFPVGTLEDAMRLSWRLHDPLLAGELKGDMPAGFHLNNSPTELLQMRDSSRPLIMLSSSGTKLMVNAAGSDVVYLSCFRNSSATARRLISERHPRVVLLGAGSRGEFREEDQICCAWIAGHLVRAGYRPEDERTLEILARWEDAKPEDCLISHSIDYLRRTGQLADLRFILDRIDDLDSTYVFRNDEVVMAKPTAAIVKPQTRVAAS